MYPSHHSVRGLRFPHTLASSCHWLSLEDPVSEGPRVWPFGMTPVHFLCPGGGSGPGLRSSSERALCLHGKVGRGGGCRGLGPPARLLRAAHVSRHTEGSGRSRGAAHWRRQRQGHGSPRRVLHDEQCPQIKPPCLFQ